MREIWFAILALLSLAATAPASAQAPAGAPAAALNVTAEDHILGKADAPITIIEYASLTCPHCRHFDQEVLPKLKEKWIDTGKARLVFRDYPLDEPAVRAAMVARCAPPERYFGFIDAIFAGQEQWAAASDYKAALARLALLGGVSKEKFATCIDDKTLENKVLASRLAATQELGVDSTPTFFIAGKKYDGAPTEAALDAALKSAGGS
jgi:protein-disulfide isomerase